MEEIHANLSPRQFERPPGIATAVVCIDSGHLATDLCRADPRQGNRTRTEVFAAQYLPTQECRVHQRFTVCTEHGYIAGQFCPPDSVATRVGLVRPIPIHDPTANVRDRHMEFPPGVLNGTICYIHLPNIDWGWPQATQTTPGDSWSLPPIGGNNFGENVFQPPAPPQAVPWTPIIPGPTPTPTPIPGTQLPPLNQANDDINQFIPLPDDNAPFPTIPLPDDE